jgi:hypothetical protein
MIGDTLVVVGTREGVDALTEIIAGSGDVPGDSGDEPGVPGAGG